MIYGCDRTRGPYNPEVLCRRALTHYLVRGDDDSLKKYNDALAAAGKDAVVFTQEDRRRMIESSTYYSCHGLRRCENTRDK